MTVSHDSNPNTLERQATIAFAMISLSVILAQGLILFDTFYGDPNIYLSYARNIAQGDPFSFNPSEFSSGSTGPLWALVLAGAYCLPWSVPTAKLLSLATTMVAFWLTYRACRKVGGSPSASALASGVVSWRGAFYGHLMYESSLLQCLLALTLWLTADLLEGRRPVAFRRWTALAAIWAAVPLTRPDAVVMVVLSFLVLAYSRRHDQPLVFRLFLTAAAASIPSVLYYGYSFIETGHFSVSATARSLVLTTGASSLAGIPFSLDTLRFLAASPVVILVGFALWAWEKRDSRDSTRHVLGFCGLVVLTYLFILTFVVPVTMSQGRYLLPSLPFLVAMAGVGLSDLMTAGFRGRHRLMALALVGALFLIPAFGALRFALHERSRGWDFDIVMEKSAADLLNDKAGLGSTVLTHEVQIRYFLRDDLQVLSLDGITDGRIVPFLKTGDMRAFLLLHRPDYWVANYAVFARPYLSKGILRQVVDAIGDQENASIEIDRIRFTNLKVNREKSISGFTGYRQLFSLSYSADTRGADALR